MSKKIGEKTDRKTAKWKRIFFFLILIFSLPFFSGIYAYAQASVYEIEKIQDLKWEIVKDRNESADYPPFVRLTWRMKVYDTNHGIYPREVRIIRTTADKDFLGIGGLVSYSGPIDANGYIQVEYIDYPPIGSLYKYLVYCPDANLPMIKTNKVETGVINFTSEGLKKIGENNEEKKKAQERYKETADWPERLVSSLIVALPKHLIKIIGLYDPIELAYGINIDSSALRTAGEVDMKYYDDSEYFGIFTEAEMRDAIGHFMTGLMNLYLYN
ncbi:hypothetical protein N752_01055 [Desulforamulus aquiferis]|nr:hypothetical protein [Desulforamulus aquiferis]RYD07203.1 hypothetical protein N752_01055 [Desulforamulus aquiferis]